MLNGNNPFKSKVDSTPQEEYPFGEDTGSLIICLNRDHRKEVREAFKVKARYILPGAANSGRRYDKIIIFTPPLIDARQVEQFKEWIEKSVLPCRTFTGVVHYV